MAVKVENTKNRAPLVFIILLIAQLLSMSWHAKERSSGQSLLQSLLLTAVYPVQITFERVGGMLDNTWRGYFALRGAHDENKQLRQDNELLRQELFKVKEELSIARRSAELGRVQNVLPYKSTKARVIARSVSEFFNNCILDKGSQAGLKLSQPVITPGGVVGRIVGLGPFAARVQLITDRYAGVGAQLSDSRAYGEIKGTGQATCEMRNVSGLETVNLGEAIITTGLDGIYPKGLLVGYVEQVAAGSGAKNHEITVRPAAGLDRLEEVLVLELTTQDLEIDETIK